MTTLQVSVEALLAFAKGLVGQELHTLAKRSRFTIKEVDLEEGAVVFLTSQGKEQPASGRWLRKTCEIFSRTNSYRPSDYKHTYGASYTLALISEFADSQPANA